jgi:hypothetical protein
MPSFDEDGCVYEYQLQHIYFSSKRKTTQCHPGCHAQMRIVQQDESTYQVGCLKGLNLLPCIRVQVLCFMFLALSYYNIDICLSYS